MDAVVSPCPQRVCVCHPLPLGSRLNHVISREGALQSVPLLMGWVTVTKEEWVDEEAPFPREDDDAGPSSPSKARREHAKVPHAPRRLKRPALLLEATTWT